MRSDLAKIRNARKCPTGRSSKPWAIPTPNWHGRSVGVVNAQNEIIPGHIHLDIIADAVKAGIRMAGGTPIEFPVIGVCDGIAMGHEGMKYSLASRELIADSIEVMAMAHPFDGAGA